MKRTGTVRALILLNRIGPGHLNAVKLYIYRVLMSSRGQLPSYLDSQRHGFVLNVAAERDRRRWRIGVIIFC
jgi:hypothetical protein